MLISLNLLVRSPVLGQVKTRLQPLLGDDGAFEAHISLFSHVNNICQSWCAKSKQRQCRVWVTSSTAHAVFAECSWVGVQPPGDLGDRLHHISRFGFDKGERVMLVGADAASITSDLLDQAETVLQDAEQVVVAPSEDGGYVLLGLLEPDFRVFDQLPWGTDRVMVITRERFQELGWSWQELPTQWDVDTPGDWQRFLEYL